MVLQKVIYFKGTDCGCQAFKRASYMGHSNDDESQHSFIQPSDRLDLTEAAYSPGK